MPPPPLPPSPPGTSKVESLPASTGPAEEPVPTEAKKAKSTWFAATIRWLHIYVSLLGFTALIFFSVTGITLNHPTWFGGDVQQLTELQGDVPLAWIDRPEGAEQAAAENPDVEIDYAKEVDKFEVVEHLRATHQLRGAVSEFRVDDRECLILFKGPGHACDIYVDRATGHYTATLTTMGFIAVINDLHKGRDTGWFWSLIIDGTALLTVFVSVTGIILIFYIKRKRWSGIITAVIGTILFAALIVWGVP